MEYVILFQIHIYALIVLIILYTYIEVTSTIQAYSQRILKRVIAYGALGIITEPLSWVFDGTQFFGARLLEYGSNFLAILAVPLMISALLSYVDYTIFKDRKRLKQRFNYHYLTGLIFALLLVNFVTPIYFSVDASNTYSSGGYIWIQYVLVGLAYIYMLFMVTHYKKRITTYSYNVLVLILALPIIGMVLEILNTKLFFSYTSISLSVLFIYIFLESSLEEKDTLTKVYTRKSYDVYVKKLIEEERSFKVLYIDLDGFKLINDTLGHLKGDEVLEQFAGYLKSSALPNQMVARLGGDEFIVVIEDSLCADDVTQNLYDKLHRSKDPTLQKLTFSYGYESYQKGMSSDELYHLVDQKMYDFKRQSH